VCEYPTPVASKPVGKLHNDRYIPLHPQLLELLTDWRSRHADHGTDLLFTRNDHPLDTNRTAGSSARLGHVHPHQLRHTSPPKR